VGTVVDNAAAIPWSHDELLQEALGEKPAETKITPLTGGNSGVLVARVQGITTGGKPFSVVMKSRGSDRPHAALYYVDDAGMLDREYQVYALLERLGLPHARVLARRYAGPCDWALILEDLTVRYVLPASDYVFSEADRNRIIDTYALIHSRTMGIDYQAASLQFEDGSEVTAHVAGEMLETVGGFEIDGIHLKPDDFDYALSILLECRIRWTGESRCLLYTDFHQTNVALPRDGTGYAVLFDWELARFGLPQFDALNAGFSDDTGLAKYAERMAAHGGKVDMQKFKAGLKYAGLSAVFYTLWLLHKKLQKDPDGRLPNWMRGLVKELFEGGLVARARRAEP